MRSLALCGALLALPTMGLAADGELVWPPVTRETRPWTRWWWMGSSVEPAGLTAALSSYRAAGLGGVEVTPIYGVRGYEDRFVPYLSTPWVERLRHTLQEAERLDLGVDMATGTGWPFGGPWVTAENAPKYVTHKTYTLEGGERLTALVEMRQEPLVRAVGTPPSIRELTEPVEATPNLQARALDQVRFPGPLALLTLVAYSDRGAVEDLTARVGKHGRLDWVAPPGRWTLYAVFQGQHGKMVERAAPGGEGNVIDHFSAASIRHYLGHFDRHLGSRGTHGLRAFFNDSYEVDDASGQADWTPAFFTKFAHRRGYDLRRHLPALFGRDTEDRNTRVLVDYRETLSDLLLSTFTREWSAWAHRRGALARNQAHGSPANILDLYAAADIPETEGNELMRIKWATSAGHVAGKRLVSAEAATWLGEHFVSTLDDVRRAVDLSFLGGVNHVFYHGTAYSPADEPWPGWLFYAAVELNPQNPWWTDFATLNRYVARVQSFLQQGRPDHDILLYFPFHEAIAARGSADLLEHFGDTRRVLAGRPFDEAAEFLQKQGYGFDFVSDRQLMEVAPRIVVVPAERALPVGTLERLVTLARAGAVVIALPKLPDDVPGLGNVDARRTQLRTLLADIRFRQPGPDGVREAGVGRGAFLQGGPLEAMLSRAGARREPMVDLGLQFVRRRGDGTTVYFVANREEAFFGWLPLSAEGGRVAIFEPMQGERGYGQTRRRPGGGIEVFLQLERGASCLLVVTAGAPAGPRYPYWKRGGAAIDWNPEWRVRFVSGGPVLPQERGINRLTSWTSWDDERTKAFAGSAAYTTTFLRPNTTAPAFRLDLGRVHDSARVRLNGRDLGTLIGPDFSVVVPAETLAATNTLDVEVTNLMANRIADLDRREVRWKKFYNVNLAARLAENRGATGLFTAASWEPRPSGLLGPVQLVPLVPQSP